MLRLFQIAIITAPMFAGCSSYEAMKGSEPEPMVNSNLYDIKITPAATEPTSTRSFWNWFEDGLTHTTLRTYRDRKWINSRDRMVVDEVAREQEITGSCGLISCNTKTEAKP